MVMCMFGHICSCSLLSLFCPQVFPMSSLSSVCVSVWLCWWLEDLHWWFTDWDKREDKVEFLLSNTHKLYHVSVIGLYNCQRQLEETEPFLLWIITGSTPSSKDNEQVSVYIWMCYVCITMGLIYQAEYEEIYSEITLNFIHYTKKCVFINEITVSS